METRPELIAIVGPTASGKTKLALELAERWNGEIICADSRTVYKDMDIGTAKPTQQEQVRVRHWGIDLVEPGESFTAADFQRYANEAIADISSRGKLPLIVGGTGLYVDAVLYNYTFGSPSDEGQRATLNAMTIDELIVHCTENNITLPENRMNKRHLVRAIEHGSISDISKSPLNPSYFIVGIATAVGELRTRIVSRTEHLFEENVAEEATILGKKYGWNSEAMTGNIYPLLKLHLEDQLTIEEVRDKVTTVDYQLAKRQMSWFRRNPDIYWCSLTETKAYIERLFATE